MECFPQLAGYSPDQPLVVLLARDGHASILLSSLLLSPSSEYKKVGSIVEKEAARGEAFHWQGPDCHYLFICENGSVGFDSP